MRLPSESPKTRMKRNELRIGADDRLRPQLQHAVRLARAEGDEAAVARGQGGDGAALLGRAGRAFGHRAHDAIALT